MSTCSACGVSLSSSQRRYCSNTCQAQFQYRAYIEQWQRCLVDGSRGTLARNLSRHVHRYLTHKFSEKCSICGWNKPHPISGRCPLEIDHIDGNSENNNESNLRLVCPNCHALTHTYRNYNSGRGRVWRKNKYRKHAR